ncbi:MAG: hypothetical protein QXX95_08405 [Nitrososphaerales archaeon]
MSSHLQPVLRMKSIAFRVSCNKLLAFLFLSALVGLAGSLPTAGLSAPLSSSPKRTNLQGAS